MRTTISVLSLLACAALTACSGDSKNETGTGALNGVSDSFDVTVDGTAVQKEDDVFALVLALPKFVSVGLQSDLPDSFSHQVTLNLGLLTMTGAQPLATAAQANFNEPDSPANIEVVITRDASLHYDSKTGTVSVDSLQLSKPDADGSVHLLGVSGSFQGTFVDKSDATHTAAISGHFVYGGD